MAGNHQLLKLRPELLNRKSNPVFWMFLSHKVLRLFVPIAMAVALVSNLLLYDWHWVFAASLLGQVAAYLLFLVPERVFERISTGPLRLLRTFVQLHWYVVLGYIEFARNREAHLWDVSPSTD